MWTYDEFRSSVLCMKETMRMISLIREIGRIGFSARSREAEEQVMTNDLGQTQDIIEAALREKLTPEALELFEKYQECSEK